MGKISKGSRSPVFTLRETKKRKKEIDKRRARLRDDVSALSRVLGNASSSIAIDELALGTVDVDLELKT